MDAAPSAADLRKAELKKLRDAALRHHCWTDKWFDPSTREALNMAVEVATHDEPYRERTIGFCLGVLETLRPISGENGCDTTPYRELLNCAALVLACEEPGMVRSMVRQVDDAIEVFAKRG